MTSAALFIDVQNIYYTVKQQFNAHFDYTLFWEEAAARRAVVKAAAYATDKGDNKQAHFQNLLRRIGFEVKLKPFLKRSDGSVKGDWDVGIAVDMMETAPNADIIVLASGDGDYSPVVDAIIEKHKVQVEIYGVQALTANGLIKSATRFIPIEGRLLLPIPKTW